MYLDKAESFFTPEGLCSFRHYREGETVTVLNEKGNWSKGTIRAFGRKPLHPVMFVDHNNEYSEVVCNLEAKWLLQPRWIIRKKKEEVKRHHRDVISFGLQVGDRPLSITTTIFSGDEVLYRLENKNLVVHEINKENHSGESWGISLKDGNFFLLEENLLFGGCQ